MEMGWGWEWGWEQGWRWGEDGVRVEMGMEVERELAQPGSNKGFSYAQCWGKL